MGLSVTLLSLEFVVQVATLVGHSSSGSTIKHTEKDTVINFYCYDYVFLLYVYVWLP